MAVVPDVEFCTTLAATTVELKVDVPVLVSEILPRPCEPPTAPVKVMLPESAFRVRFLAPLTVLLNTIPGVVDVVTRIYPLALFDN
jgi:hypothetical protein